MQIPYSVDSTGLVIGPRLHDGFLCGIEDVLDGGLLIKCRRRDGANVTLCFEGATLLRANDWVFGNIFDSLFQWPMHVAPDSARSFLLSNLVKGEDASAFWDRLVTEQSEDYLYLIECSYGATVAILAKTLCVEEA